MMSFYKVLLTPCLCAVILAQTPAPAPKLAMPVSTPPDKVILTIGTEKMTAAEFDEFIESLPEQYRMAARGPAKRQLVEQLISLKTLSQEARRRKLDQSTSFKKQMAFQADNLLAGALFRDLAANIAVDEAAARKYFEDHKNEYEEVKARHILIRMKGSAMPVNGAKPELSEEEALAKAQSIRAKLTAGADFAELAKVESDDTTTGANGGDLGAFKHGQMVPPFEQAAFSLPVGAVSEPVKTQFGYHLIKVISHATKTMEEVRPEMELKLKPDLARQAVEKLRKEIKVEVDEGYFGPATPAAGAPKQ